MLVMCKFFGVSEATAVPAALAKVIAQQMGQHLYKHKNLLNKEFHAGRPDSNGGLPSPTFAPSKAYCTCP